MSYPVFAVTVDLVVLTVREGELCVLLVRRGIEPYKDQWALPGGFVHADEDLDRGGATRTRRGDRIGRSGRASGAARHLRRA